MNLFKAILAIRSVGVAAAARTLSYSLKRDRLNQRYTAYSPTGDPLPPGQRLEIQPLPDGGRFRFQNAELEIRFLKPDLVRLSWSPGKEPLPYGLAQTQWPPVEVHWEPSSPSPDEGIYLSTSELSISLASDGGLQFASPGKPPFRLEQPPIHQMTAIGEPIWTHRVRLEPEEHLYGLGERAAHLNRRGASYKFWNTDPGGSYGLGADPLYIGIPAYLSLHPGGSCFAFYENAHPAELNLPSNDSNDSYSQFRFEGGMLRYYLIPGPLDRLLPRFTELTGRPPLPPRWALGYHQSRWGYKCEADIRLVAQKFKERGLPLSAIHLDIDYMDGYRVFSVDRERFPDLKALSTELAEQGVRLVTILDPGIKVDPRSNVYRSGLEAGAFVKLPNGELSIGLVWPGPAAFPDFTNPKVRRWWGEQYMPLLEAGVDGFWHDMNEPAAFTAWGDATLPEATRFAMEGRGGDARDAHNLYGLLMARAGFESLQRLQNGRRPWIVSRSAWAGIQRYAWNWTGDIESSWEALRMTISMVIGLGLSGQPYSGPDVGGFSGDPSPELHLRWFQTSACLPFFRTHSAIGTRPREPYVFESPYAEALDEALRLRQQLLPYTYTLAWKSAQTGLPLVRPLFWYSPDRQALWDVEDQFLLGRDLLVAPVLEPGAVVRKVRLPGGAWYSLETDEVYDELDEVELPVDLNSLPLLVRTGSILPLAEVEAGSEDGSATWGLVLHIYPYDGYAQGQLYTDAGDGPIQNDDDYRLDRFTASLQSGEWTIRQETQGRFPWPYPRVMIQFHGLPVEKVTIAGRTYTCSNNRLELTTLVS